MDMKEFIIRTEEFLGCHCNGCGEYAEGEGMVNLTEEQVQQLVDLIKANGGSTDVAAIGLGEKLPEVYAALDEAYREVALQANYAHWILEGFENGWIEQPEGLMDQLIEEGVFESGLDLDELRSDLGLDEDEEIDEEDLEEARKDEFNTWLYNHTLLMSSEELVQFVEDYFGDAIFDWDPSEVEYEVKIPEEVVELSKN